VKNIPRPSEDKLDVDRPSNPFNANGVVARGHGGSGETPLALEWPNPSRPKINKTP
jgi:hypothetical protein